MFLLKLIAIICVFPLLRLASAQNECMDVPFDDHNRDQWFTCMENHFDQADISDDKKTTYAIEVGLASSSELQGVMASRSIEYSRGSLRQAWPWGEFKDDISRVSDAAVLVQSRDVYSTVDSLVAAMVDSNSSFKFTISDGALQQILLDRNGPAVENQVIMGPRLSEADIQTLWSFPSLDEILRRIREFVEQAKAELEKVYEEGSANAKEVLDKIQNFVQAQIEQLPNEVRVAVLAFDRFRKEHPYIVAGATVALTVIAVDIIMPYAVLGVLRMVGFGEMGPVAGSWAALTQSALYGGRTRGLFSVIQKMTMTAKLFWPVRVLTDITAIAAGLLVWSPGDMKDTVEAWARNDPSLAFPDLNLLAAGNDASLEVLENWMVEFGKKCADAGMPEVQWFDGAIYFLTHEVGQMVNQRGF